MCQDLYIYPERREAFHSFHSFTTTKIIHLECFEVVDENVWHPEVVDEVEVDWGQGVRLRCHPAQKQHYYLGPPLVSPPPHRIYQKHQEHRHQSR